MARTKQSIRIARKLRREATPSEKILWHELRNRKLQGLKFLRQYPIVHSWIGKAQFYVADFYCHEHKLILELDGSIHFHLKERDASRDACLLQMGFRTLRIPNKELKNMDHVREKILNFILEINKTSPLFASAKRGAGGES